MSDPGAEQRVVRRVVPANTDELVPGDPVTPGGLTTPFANSLNMLIRHYQTSLSRGTGYGLMTVGAILTIALVLCAAMPGVDLSSAEAVGLALGGSALLCAGAVFNFLVWSRTRGLYEEGVRSDLRIRENQAAADAGVRGFIVDQQASGEASRREVYVPPTPPPEM